MSDLDKLFKALSEAKVSDPRYKAIKSIKESIKTELVSTKVEPTPKKPEQKTIKEEIIVEEIPDIESLAKNRHDAVVNLLKKQPEANTFQQPEVDSVSKEMKAVTDKLKFLEKAIGKIAATGPGSGEVNLRYLDDVDRASIADGLFLKYQASSGKFVFASQAHEEPQVDTVLVSSATYTLTPTDSYVGVNYAGEVTVTLPTGEIGNGRLVYIKDESGLASTNPITVVGTVDNDPSGFILQLDNGSVQLIYREGWRIV